MNWFSQALIIIFAFIIIMGLLARSKKTWKICGCGHESSWHSNDGGCKFKNYGANPGYDYVGNCTCPRTATEAERDVG